MDALLQQLDAIEAACREERWDDAEALMQEHDQALRAVDPGAWRAETLQALISRQRSLAEAMREARDAAGAELNQFGASRRGAKAYQR